MEGYCRHCGQYGEISTRAVCLDCAEARISANIDRMIPKTNVPSSKGTEECVPPAQDRQSESLAEDEDQEEPEPRRRVIW